MVPDMLADFTGMCVFFLHRWCVCFLSGAASFFVAYVAEENR